jgi:hypothetical protein
MSLKKWLRPVPERRTNPKKCAWRVNDFVISSIFPWIQEFEAVHKNRQGLKGLKNPEKYNI